MFNFLSDMEIVDDPAGQSPGDLFYQDLPMRIADNYTVPLVFRRRFGMPCYQVLALMILTVGYLSAHRIAVLMDIGRTHENGNLQAPVPEIFFVNHFFNDHHLPVSRANDKIVAGC